MFHLRKAVFKGLRLRSFSARKDMTKRLPSAVHVDDKMFTHPAKPIGRTADGKVLHDFDMHTEFGQTKQESDDARFMYDVLTMPMRTPMRRMQRDLQDLEMPFDEQRYWRAAGEKTEQSFNELVRIYAERGELQL